MMALAVTFRSRVDGRPSLTHEIAPFEPRNPPDVGTSSCRATVYAYQHIGNLRGDVFAHTLKRAVRWRVFRVRHVMNITHGGQTSDADEG
jgi:cysteinyl-tRNA synthetase